MWCSQHYNESQGTVGYEDVESYFQACRPCQMRNSPNSKPQAPLGNIKAKYSFHWDITGPLPETERYILVLTDLFSKCMGGRVSTEDNRQ